MFFTFQGKKENSFSEIHQACSSDIVRKKQIPGYQLDKFILIGYPNVLSLCGFFVFFFCSVLIAR